MYSTQQLIEMSIRKQLLNELFSETISELPQAELTIHDSNNIDVGDLVSQINDDDILITNNQYNIEKSDFMVINSSGDIILTVSPDGYCINNNAAEYYLEDENAFNALTKLYNKIKNCGNAYTLQLSA